MAEEARIVAKTRCSFVQMEISKISSEMEEKVYAATIEARVLATEEAEGTFAK